MSTTRPAKPAPRWPAQLLVQLLAMVTLLLAARPLGLVLEGASWWTPILLIAAFVVAVGAVARAGGLPWWTRTLTQAGAVVVLVGLIFGVWTPASAVVWWQAAAVEAHLAVPPAEVTLPIAFLLATAFAAAALATDAIATRVPAIVALPVAVLLIAGALFVRGGVPLAMTLPPVLAYLLLLAVAGQGRRVVDAAAVPHLVGAAAVTAALAVIGAVVVTPWIADALDVGTQGPYDLAASGQGIAESTDLVGDLLRGEPVPMLRVTGGDEPGYLRTATLERWTDDQRWEVGDLQGGSLPAVSDQPGVSVFVTSRGYEGRFLAFPDDAIAISVDQDEWRWDSAASTAFVFEALRPGVVQAWLPEQPPTELELRRDSATATGNLVSIGNTAEQVVDLAQELTAGEAGDFEQAVALRDFFLDPANGFVYSLDVLEGDSGDPLVDFLTLRQGYCEQYASAMAVMARAVGLPARVVVGFGPGTQGAPGEWEVTSRNAHAWVEIRFDDAGWVRFDPTPPDGVTPRSQGYEAGGVIEEDASEGASATAAPTAAPTGPEAGEGATAQLADDAASPTAGAGTPGAGGGGSQAWRGWLVALLVGLVLALAPTLLRRRAAVRRLRAARRGGPAGAEAAWREIEALAVDHGVVVRDNESLRVLAGRVARVAGLDDEGKVGLTRVVRGTEEHWYAPAVLGALPPQPRGRWLRRPASDRPRRVIGTPRR